MIAERNDKSGIRQLDMPSPAQEVEQHLIEATFDLFEAYELKVKLVEPPESATPIEGVTVMATVGFAGEFSRGALVLVTSMAAVLLWQHQLGGSATSTEEASDTIGEFSNMLLGRLKYRLLLRGVTILLSTPTVAIGHQISIPPTGAVAARWIRFGGSAGRLDVRLGATYDPEFAFATGAPEEVPAGAGDMMMF